MNYKIFFLPRQKMWGINGTVKTGRLFVKIICNSEKIPPISPVIKKQLITQLINLFRQQCRISVIMMLFGQMLRQG